MKKVTMFYLKNCPHCKKAFDMIDNLKNLNSDFCNVEIDLIEESQQPDIANSYDYYYVPTFFVGDAKLHEGTPTLEAVKSVLEAAMAD